MTNATNAQPSNTDINEASGRVSESAHKLAKHLNNLSPRDFAETSWYHEALEVTGAETYYSEFLTIREDLSDASDVYVLDGPDGRAMVEYYPHRQAWVVIEDISKPADESARAAANR